jgi:phosphatidylinositol 4-kinase
MGRRSDLYDVYLAELLALFSDKGVAIQDAAVSERHGKVSYGLPPSDTFINEEDIRQTEEMMEQLASLLLPIEALLDHADFSPHLNSELMIPFRNMWFLCILFHFTASGEEKEREKSAMTWLLPALGRIALKTPCFVLESVPDAPSDMEYRTVVRREYAHSVSASVFARYCDGNVADKTQGAGETSCVSYTAHSPADKRDTINDNRSSHLHVDDA